MPTATYRVEIPRSGVRSLICCDDHALALIRAFTGPGTIAGPVRLTWTPDEPCQMCQAKPNAPERVMVEGYHPRPPV
jgi:hypothetical protein